MLDPQRRRSIDGERLLVRPEVVGPHRGDVGLGVGRPLPHRVWMLLRVLLDRLGRPAIGVALAQDGVHRRAHHLVVPRPDLALFGCRRLVGEVGKVVALGLQLGDSRRHLRDRCADVGQLDDVDLWGERHLTEFREGVVDPLLRGEALGEGGDDAPGERDVARLDLDARDAGERLDDRQQRIGRQRRRFVGVRVDDLGVHGFPIRAGGATAGGAGVHRAARQLVSNLSAR